MVDMVLQTIKTHQMLQPSEKVLVALSGGADSVVLLYLLREITDDICAAHINHGLRATAINDEIFVKDLCAQLNIPLKIYKEDISAVAAQENISIEEAGRKIRYQRLQETAAYFNAQKIATGHHQNDNAETIILNLVRGTGLKGLCGIPYINGNIIRPLLDMPRKKIDEYISEHNLTYATDETNNTLEYTRNRIRHTVLPIIEEAINPNATKTIAGNAKILQDEEDFLTKVAQAQYEGCKEGVGSLNIKKLSALHPAITRRVIRLAINELGALKDITAAHIEDIINLAQKKSGKEIHLPGIIVCKEYENIVIKLSGPKKAFGQYLLELNKPVYISELNQTITFTNIPILATKNNEHLCTKSFDYDTIAQSVCVRTRRPGDKLKLSTGSGKTFTKKLQDYFSDKKTPTSIRDYVPLVTSGANVLWVMDKFNTTSTAHIVKEETKNICWIILEGAINHV